MAEIDVYIFLHTDTQTTVLPCHQVSRAIYCASSRQTVRRTIEQQAKELLKETCTSRRVGNFSTNFKASCDIVKRGAKSVRRPKGTNINITWNLKTGSDIFNSACALTSSFLPFCHPLQSFREVELGGKPKRLQ